MNGSDTQPIHKPTLPAPGTPEGNTFTDFFISHPVFAWVVNIVLILLGVMAYYQLPTRQYPATEGSLITVRTNMDGSSKTLETQVTTPLEDSFSSVPGVHTIESETQKGESKIRLTFLGRSLDAAAADVREAIARTRLPDNIDPPVPFKGDIDGASVMELALTGDNIALPDLYYIGSKVIKTMAESVPGVAVVEVSGGSEFVMRVELDPLKMKSYGVASADIARALKTHNFQQAAGAIREEEREITLTTQSSLRTPQEFRDIVLRSYDNKLVRLGDVARVAVSTDEERIRVTYNGKPAVSLILRPQSNANPIEISKEMRKRLEKVKGSLQPGVHINIALDKALFIKDSVGQVYHALFEAVVLVLVVILVFLRSFKAALIPLITIPIALMGTFFIMYVLGFTINVLSLLALVLAIGLVVDDAIVVLENIYRYIELGHRPMRAAILGAREIRFSVIAMTLTLAAVYAPIAMVSGVVGKVFKEFALTLAGAVLVSGFTALTLSPPMCARLLKAHGHGSDVSGAVLTSPPLPWPQPGKHRGLGLWIQRMHWTWHDWSGRLSAQLASGSHTPWHNSISQRIESVLTWLDVKYKGAVQAAMGVRWWVVMGATVFSVGSGVISWYNLNKEMSPPVDEGLLYIRLSYIAGKNLNYMTNRSPWLENLVAKEPAVQTRMMTLQTMQDSYIQAQLKPWHQRQGKSCQDMLLPLRSKIQDIQGIEGIPYCPSESIISSRSPQYPLALKIMTDKGADELIKIGRAVRRALRKFEGIREVDIFETATVAEYELRFTNPDRMTRLGVDPDEVAQAFQLYVRGNNIGRFEKNQRTYPVRVKMQEHYTDSMEKIKEAIYVRGKDAQGNVVMLPVTDLVEFVYTPGDPVIEHSFKKRSYDVRASLKPGYSLAETYLAFRDTVLKDILPSEYEVVPAGELKRYFDEQGTIVTIFGLATLFIFLVMAAQFESVRDPLIILFSVPLALGGALLSLFLIKGGSLNIYSQIGLITLIGLITKHGILLVDFANQRKADGVSVIDAMVQACQLRLRPIIMTTLAMVLGALPLAFASGAGAEARRQIGAVIVGGMTLGTLFTLFVVPVVYTLLTRKNIPSDSQTA